MASLVCIAIQLYLLIVLVRIIMSWFLPTPGTTYAQIFEVFDRLTEPHGQYRRRADTCDRIEGALGTLNVTAQCVVSQLQFGLALRVG